MILPEAGVGLGGWADREGEVVPALSLGEGAALGSEVQLPMTPGPLCWKHSGLCITEWPHSTC